MTVNWLLLPVKCCMPPGKHLKVSVRHGGLTAVPVQVQSWLEQ